MEGTQSKSQVEIRMAEKKKALPRIPEKRKKWVRALITVLIAALAVYWFILRPSGGTGTVGAGQYLVDTVRRQDLTVSVSGSGTMAPIDSYQVNALITGEVLESPFEAGDQVEKGQLLYRLDGEDGEINVQQAQLNLRQAQAAYDELAAGLTPSASASGVVQQVYVQKGEAVSAGSPIADVADTSTMTLTLPFQSADAAGLSVGQSAQVTIAGTLETLPGTVESVSSAELVGSGGALVRQVKLRVNNPGALTAADSATAVIGDVACAGSGTFEENMRQTVVAQTSGEVTAVHVTSGSRVSAGTALVTLGGSAVQTALTNGEIAVENARLSLQRAQDALEDYTIAAPISGTVIEKNVKAGDKVDGIESGALAVIYDLSSLKLQMNVNELDIGKVRTGQTVEITADALPGQVFFGTVEKLSINGTTTDGFTTYPVTILLTDYGELNPGMNVSAEIIVERAEQVLCVPVAAVAQGNVVLVPGEGALTPDGTAVADPSKLEERTVTIGRGDQEYIEITSGLEEGDTVLILSQARGNGMEG